MVILNPDHKGKVSGEDLVDFLQRFVQEGIIQKWSIPDRLYIVDEIPKTSVGKIDKKAIRKGLVNGHGFEDKM